MDATTFLLTCDWIPPPEDLAEQVLGARSNVVVRFSSGAVSSDTFILRMRHLDPRADVVSAMYLHKPIAVCGRVSLLGDDGRVVLDPVTVDLEAQAR